MSERAKNMRHPGKAAIAAAGMLPGLALAHGSGHLHFWGRHLTEILPIPTVLALLAMAALGWWLGREGR